MLLPAITDNPAFKSDTVLAIGPLPSIKFGAPESNGSIEGDQGTRPEKVLKMQYHNSRLDYERSAISLPNPKGVIPVAKQLHHLA